MRAKTGTLSNVRSLTGITVDQDRHEVLFPVIADRIREPNKTKARRALDAEAGAARTCTVV